MEETVASIQIRLGILYLQTLKTKLSKNKYSGPYQKQILLLHNYSMLGNTKFSTDIHFYTHHRNDIFNLIWKYINQYNSFSFYNGISFLDFSNYAFNRNFDLLDFKKFSLIQPSEFLYGYDEIRVELRPPENNND